MEKMVIIGSGPAGLTAAIYGARANLSPVLFEGHLSGGQLMTTTTVENFPGFPDGVLGPSLMESMRRQAERLGARLVADQATGVTLSPRRHRVRAGDGELAALTLVIATGAAARLLGLPGEEELIGRGVSTCATCDGFFFRGKDVVVIGGGDSALEEAVYLAGLARRVRIVHRRDRFRASAALQDRARAHANIGLLTGRVPVRFVPSDDGVLRAVRLRHTATGEEETVEADGAFVAIGHTPRTELVAGQLALDEAGYIVTTPGTGRTSVEGVFAAGDVQDRHYMQAITAAGSGCRAALDAARYVESTG